MNIVVRVLAIVLLTPLIFSLQMCFRLPSVAYATIPLGFSDQHDDGQMDGWMPYGNRPWIEAGGFMSPLEGYTEQSFLINSFPVTSDGTLEAVITGEQWNGYLGGVVFRWTGSSSYYYIGILPGNEWTSSLIFCKDTMDISAGIVVASPLSISTTYTLKVVMSGPNFQFYLDGVLVGSLQDSAHPWGDIGYGYTATWPDFLDFHSILWEEAVSGETGVPDSDGDRVNDLSDNCLTDSNSDQLDTDFDTMGDVCDEDDDNDGIVDEFDNSPLVPNPDQTDTDGDGIGDVSDPDIDNDGIDNENDNCVFIPNPEQTDSDNDTVGDECDQDTDMDDDLIPDTVDNCPLVPNQDQKDSDNDGIGDVCDLNGFIDEHDNDILDGWTVYGERSWYESGGRATPEHKSDEPGFLINNYLTFEDGTLEVDITADQWSGHNGGVVFRWTSPQSYYYATVVPATLEIGILYFCTDSMYDYQCSVVADDLTLDPTYTLRAELNGNIFNFYLNGVYVGNVIDNAHPAGQVGYGYNGVWNDYIDYLRIFWEEAWVVQPSDQDDDGVIDSSDNCQSVPNPDQSDSDGDGIGDACDRISGGPSIVVPNIFKPLLLR